MAHIKRKYIDSHWLIFIIQGLITLGFGCVMLFTPDRSPSGLIPVIGAEFLLLAVVEFINALYRSHYQHGWLAATAVALFDTIFGIMMFVWSGKDMVWHLMLISIYTLLRGVFELVLAFRTTVDPTDRFIWALCGICGFVFGIVILNSGHLANVDFIRFFGAYMLILGVSSLIYGAHNRAQSLEDHEARVAAARFSKKVTQGRKKSSKR